MPFATSSFVLLVVGPGATSSFLPLCFTSGCDLVFGPCLDHSPIACSVFRLWLPQPDIRLKGATESELLLAFSTKPLCGSGEAGLEVQNTLAGCKGSTRCN